MAAQPWMSLQVLYAYAEVSETGIWRSKWAPGHQQSRAGPALQLPCQLLQATEMRVLHFCRKPVGTWGPAAHPEYLGPLLETNWRSNMACMGEGRPMP